MRVRTPVRSLVPSKATLIAMIALAFALAGTASAAPKDNPREEVLLQTASGPPSTSIDNRSDVEGEFSYEEVPIPLTNGSFTQLAGEAVVIAARMIAEPVSGTCDLRVHVTDANDLTGVGMLMRSFHERGEVGQDADVEALPAPSVDTLRVLVAAANVGLEDKPGCQMDVNGDPAWTEWTVSLSVTVVRLR